LYQLSLLFRRSLTRWCPDFPLLHEAGANIRFLENNEKKVLCLERKIIQERKQVSGHAKNLNVKSWKGPTP